LEHWVSDLAPVGSTNTVAGRRWAVRHLAPLHGVPIDALRTEDVEHLFARLVNTLGHSSLQRIRTVLGQALHAALRRHVITWNPAGSDDGRPRVVIPRQAEPRRDRRALTLEQVHTLLEVAEGDAAEALIVLGLFGLRPGEVTGLRWCDVDLEANTLTVAQMRRREADGSLSFCDPKAGSFRVLDMPDLVADFLTRHQAAQRRARMIGRAAYDNGGLVVCTRTGAPMDPSNHRREIARVAKAAGIFLTPNLSPNELRHSAASLWVELGMSLPAVADILGHKDLRMVTQTYRHKVRPTAAAPVGF
jgi:integrase